MVRRRRESEEAEDTCVSKDDGNMITPPMSYEREISQF